MSAFVSLVELVLTEKTTGNGMKKCVFLVQNIARRYRTELPAGTLKYQAENYCVMCSVGTYSRDGGANCTSCPDNMTTIVEGTKSRDGCGEWKDVVF